jgi:hypothetical protein
MDLDPVSTNPDAYRVLEYTDTPGHRTTPLAQSGSALGPS